MMENMSWDLLRLWIQYIEVEPFGSVSENLQRGVIAAMIGNANINPKKTKPFRAQDFLLGVLPTKNEPKKSNLTDEQKAQVQKTNRKIKMQAMIRAQQLRMAYQEKRRNNRKRLTANRLPPKG